MFSEIVNERIKFYCRHRRKQKHNAVEKQIRSTAGRSERPTVIYRNQSPVESDSVAKSAPTQAKHKLVYITYSQEKYHYKNVSICVNKLVVHANADTRAATLPLYNVKSDLMNTD